MNELSILLSFIVGCALSFLYGFIQGGCWLEKKIKEGKIKIEVEKK